MANYAFPLWTIPTALIIIILISLAILICFKCRHRSTSTSAPAKKVGDANCDQLWKRNFTSEYNYTPYSYAKCRVLPPPPPLYDSIILAKGTNPSYSGPNDNNNGGSASGGEPSSSCGDHGHRTSSFKSTE